MTIFNVGFSQTNIFPQSGRVGIGTTTPRDTTSLHIKGSHTTTSSLLEYPLDASSQLQGSVFLRTWASEPDISWNGAGIGTNVNNWGLVRMNKSLSSSYIRFIPQKTSGMMLFTTIDAAGVKYDNTMAVVNDKVGIGTTNPLSPLHLVGGSPMSTGWNKTLTLQATYPTIIFNSNAQKWGGIGYDFSSNMNFWVGGSSDDIAATATAAISITQNGKVGIGTSAPTEKLEVNGNLLLSGAIKYGNSGVRTESRNNAGLQGNAGAMSGFYETYAPLNFPKDDSNWWHLIDTRHSNNTNNYAMQFAGSFFDQKLYFRKTNNSPTQPWREVLTADPNGELTIGKSDYTGGSLFLGNASHGIKRGYTANGNDVGFFTTSGDLYLSTTNSTPQFVLKNSGNVGVGTTTPTEKLTIYGTNNAAPGVMSFESSREDVQNAEVGILKAKNSGVEIARMGLNRAGGSNTGFLNFWVKKTNETSLYEAMRISENGNVGIGTANPTEKLEIQGNTILSGINTKQIYNWTGVAAFSTGILGSTTNNSRFSISTNSAGEVFSVSYLNGNIGIGTTDTKGYKLAVNGDMIAERVVVKLQTNWPDYVFKKTYGLRPLEQVEQYINQNSHLPEVPSAQEVSDKGIDVGAMNAKLLQKIEELTLYLIEQNKEIKTLKNKVEVLEKK